MFIPMQRRGEKVVVKRVTEWVTDSMGDEIPVWETIEVDGVLVAPGAAEFLTGVTADDGVKVAFTCYFPKTFTGSLRGGQVTIRGEDFDVVGDPRPWPAAETPGPRNLVVPVQATEG